MKRIGVLAILCALLLCGCGEVTKTPTESLKTAATTVKTSVTSEKQTTTTEESKTEETTVLETTQKTTTTTRKEVVFEDEQKTYYAKNDGSVRLEPYDDAKIESRMKEGEAIYVISTGDNGWYKVKYKDNIRYIWGENLSKNKPTTEATVATKKGPSNSSSTSSKGYSIVTKNGMTYVDGVLVANKTYSLPSSYNPGGLLPECDKAYDKMDAAAAKAGYELYISSGFRSYGTQESIYNRYVANDGKANADRYSARPGYSEHQTGLAIDLNGVSDSFGDTATGKWVAAHCHEYGFILRYPKGKEAQTGYMYEPWHIRYVGVDVATKIYNSGLCFEEYYGITSQYD